MYREKNESSGIQKLIQACKAAFRIPENIDYYSDEDYKIAERKFIKITCMEGTIPIDEILPSPVTRSHREHAS